MDARRLLDDAGKAVDKAKSSGRGESGQLHIGFTGSAAFNPLVPRLIRHYRQLYPGVSLTLAEGNTAQLLNLLKEERLDAAFVRLGNDSPAGFSLDHIATEPMKLVLPSRHPLAAKRKIALESVAGEPFVLLPHDASPTLYNVIVGACRDAGFDPMTGQQAPQLSSVVNLVAAEFGISIVPASVSQFQVEGTVFRDIAGKPINISLALAARAGAINTKAANFLANARRFIGEMAGSERA